MTTNSWAHMQTTHPERIEATYNALATLDSITPNKILAVAAHHNPEESGTLTSSHARRRVAAIESTLNTIPGFRRTAQGTYIMARRIVEALDRVDKLAYTLR